MNSIQANKENNANTRKSKKDEWRTNTFYLCKLLSCIYMNAVIFFSILYLITKIWDCCYYCE